MKTALILDTETTGFSPSSASCIEVAAIRYSLEHAAIVEVYSTLLSGETSNAAEKVNRISPKLLPMGTDVVDAWKRVGAMQCDCVLAHNAKFDRSFVPSSILNDVPWIDTYKGVTWPKASSSSKTLVQIALDHGLAVVDPHRALNDCLLLTRLLTRVHELGVDLNDLLTKPRAKAQVYEALVSYETKELAKEAGFTWDSKAKKWVKELSDQEVEDAPTLKFKIRKVVGGVDG